MSDPAVAADGALVLEARKVTRRFGGLVAVREVDFQVGERQIIGLIGPNGAGKTTFFNCITGMFAPSEGDVLFDGRRINGLPPDRITKLGIARTFQNLRLFANMTALENVLVGRHCRTREGVVSAVLRGRRDAASIDVGTPAWNDSVRAAQTNLERVEADVRQLEAGFRAARHRRGVRLVAELTSLLGKTRRALGELSQAADAQAARIALTHLVAGLEALLQTIDEGKRCCRISQEGT